MNFRASYLFFHLLLSASLISGIQPKEVNEVLFELNILVAYEYSASSLENSPNDSIDLDINIYSSIHTLAELMCLNGFALKNVFRQLPSVKTLIRAPPIFLY